MSETPKTDAAQLRHTYLPSRSLPDGCLSTEFADFARELERENATLRAALSVELHQNLALNYIGNVKLDKFIDEQEARLKEALA